MVVSYSHGASAVPLVGRTIGETLAEVARRHPDVDAVVAVQQGVRLTYAEFDREVDRVARGLLGLGLVKGDRVGIWSPNTVEWVLVQFATARVGLILVNINPAYRTHELEYALRQSGCRMLVAATEFRTSDYRAMVAEARPSLPGLECVVYVETAEWDQLLAAGDRIGADALTERAVQLSFDDAINIQYTSGTTGFPKGATLSHHNVLNNGYLTTERCHYTAADRVCIPVPLYHAFGSVLGTIACATHGATMVLPAPGFEPAATLETVQHERCTSLYGVPTMFIAELALANFADYDLSSLRTGLIGGAPCPLEVMKRCMNDMHMEEITIGYGMTETLISTQTLTDDPIDKRVGTVGRVHPHVEVKLVDPATGLAVPRGTPGELCARGYPVMLGYWNDPERTAEAIDAARWMHTGDLATMDDEGYVNIVGRIKDMIIRGGENVYPREIEELLYSHPDIIEVQVIGVPDVKYGEEIMAWVKVRDGATLDEESLRVFCDGKMARYKIPRYVHLTDEFPMTVTGKVQKYKMREAAIELLGLQEAAQVQTA